MDQAANQRVSPSRVVLMLALLLGVWLAFQFYPRPAKPVPPPPAPVAAESRLRAVGLADNPDWDGLPEIFAVWADQAPWQDGRTKFAYWNPANRDYSYDFEAVRVGDKFHFRELHEGVEGMLGEPLAEGCPIRFYHPNPRYVDPVSRSDQRPETPADAGLDSRKVDVNISQPVIEMKPATEVLPNPSLPDPARK